MRYWLMKSEPDAFSIHDLAQKGRERWDGVRNFQARNFMRDEMRMGDLVLFYHSSVTPAGVVGLAEVVSESYTDLTQFDPQSDYYDPRSKKEQPLWQLVDIGYVRTFPKMVPLDELRIHPATQTMRVCQRGNRLSITPVTEQEFQAVLALAEA